MPNRTTPFIPPLGIAVPDGDPQTGQMLGRAAPPPPAHTLRGQVSPPLGAAGGGGLGLPGAGGPEQADLIRQAILRRLQG